MVTRLLRGRRWLAALLLLSLLVPAGVAVGTARPASATIDPALLRQTAGSAQTTFWVLLRSRADLRPAAVTRGWTQRGQAVVDHLQATARASQADILTLLRARGAAARPFWIANAVQVTGDRATLDALAARPEVAKILPDRTLALPAPRDRAPAEAAAGLEWNVTHIRAPEVWSTFDDRGEGIVVASIDTGVQFDHPALVAQYRGNQGGGVFDHNYNWFDAIDDCSQPAPCDDVSHGTHTMGTILGDDGDPGSNQIGVAPHARWITAKACGMEGCPIRALLAAGEWMLAPTDLQGLHPRPDLRPQIISNSWGGWSDDFFQAIVDAWVAAGIFPVFSAGNSGPGCGSVGSPGDYTNSYSVGAFDRTDTIAWFSSRGPALGGDTATVKPNIAAPGVDVRSSVPGGSYATMSGTSMAAPHVAGTVALIWAAAPALLGDIAATRELLDQTAIDVADNSCDGYPSPAAGNIRNNVWGEGRLDAFAAVERAPRGPSGVIGGTISDAATGAPIAGATVRDSNPPERSTSSGADGGYQLRLSVGSYTLSADAFGYATQTITDVLVEADHTTRRDIALAALPADPLEGHIRDAAGQPIPNVRLTLADTPIATVTTDAEGFYRFASVPAGSYTLQVRPGGCYEPQTEQLTLDGQVTHDLTLAAHADGYGYGCALEPAHFVDANTVLPIGGYYGSAAVDLPFSFTLYGQSYAKVYVNADGALSFLAPDYGYGHGALPNPSPPNAAIYPFWENLYVDSLASVRSEVIGVAPDRQLAIEWRNVALCCDMTERVTFEVVLDEHDQILMQYHAGGDSARVHGGSATVGIEDERGAVALQYSYRTPRLDPQFAVRYRLPPNGFVQGVVTDANDHNPLANATVRALAGAAVARETTTNAHGAYRLQLPLGSYTLEASSPRYRTAELPATVALEGERVTQDISLATASASIDPPAIERLIPANQQRTIGLTIQNTGTLTLEWRLRESNVSQLPAAAAPAYPSSATQPRAWRAPELPAGLALAPHAAGVGGSLDTVIVDPAGDASGAVDITTVRGGAPGGQDMTVAIDFSADTPIDQVHGYVLFDADQSTDTGLPPTSFSGRPEQTLGVDYFASLFNLQGDGSTIPILSVRSGEPVALATAHIVSNTISFSVPLAALGDGGPIDTALVLGDVFGRTDWAPDTGHGTINVVADVPWLATNVVSGTLAPGASTTVAVTLNTARLAAGRYDAALVLQSNSGRRPTLRVPVHLVVPTYHQTVNVGGAAYQDQIGDVWVADQAYQPGGWGYLDRPNIVRTGRPIAGTADDALYQDARSGLVEYRFDGLPDGVYEVELRFAEIQGQPRGRRLFDVVVGGQLALPAYDIAGEAGAYAADDQVIHAAVRGGRLSIRFVPRTGYGSPLINAIRVTQRPDR